MMPFKAELSSVPPCRRIKLRITLQRRRSQPLNSAYWRDSSSSPLHEPRAATKPRADFPLNQLWLPLIIQQANNESRLWGQSKSNVCSVDNVSNQNRLSAWRICERCRGEDIHSMGSLLLTQQGPEII